MGICKLLFCLKAGHAHMFSFSPANAFVDRLRNEKLCCFAVETASKQHLDDIFVASSDRICGNAGH